MSTKVITLHYRSKVLDRPIDHVLLKQLLDAHPNALLSLEPAIALPVSGGHLRAGRHPQFQTLGRSLPPEGILIQEAAVYDNRTWVLLAAPQIASDWPGRELVWSLDDMPESTPVGGLRCESGTALAWRDRQRFGLPDSGRFDDWRTERFYDGAELIAWRVLPPPAKEGA